MSDANQRQLRQEYKDNPPAIGVYLIQNVANQRYLLASSNNVEGAINRHCFELKMRGHRNKALQQDWLADGEAQFRFSVLDTVTLKDDPAFDVQAELAGLLTLWQEEMAKTRGEVY
ncbi:MAG: GIY-YIG nuclease family protein [Burkholderiales bacterium]|nr:GIY-YIG nuclease family protein [Burkholderiales bacterium]